MAICENNINMSDDEIDELFSTDPESPVTIKIVVDRTTPEKKEIESNENASKDNTAESCQRTNTENNSNICKENVIVTSAEARYPRTKFTAKREVKKFPGKMDAMRKNTVNKPVTTEIQMKIMKNDHLKSLLTSHDASVIANTLITMHIFNTKTNTEKFNLMSNNLPAINFNYCFAEAVTLILPHKDDNDFNIEFIKMIVERAKNLVPSVTINIFEATQLLRDLVKATQEEQDRLKSKIPPMSEKLKRQAETLCGRNNNSLAKHPERCIPVVGNNTQKDIPNDCRPRDPKAKMGRLVDNTQKTPRQSNPINSLTKPYNQNKQWQCCQTSQNQCINESHPPNYLEQYRNVNYISQNVHLQNNVNYISQNEQLQNNIQYAPHNTQSQNTVLVDTNQIRPQPVNSADSGIVSPVTDYMNSNYPDTMPNQQSSENVNNLVVLPISSCSICRTETRNKCKGCHKVYYCSLHCQNIDWKYHYSQCGNG